MIKELSFMEYAKFTIRYPIHWYWWGALMNPLFDLYLLINQYKTNIIKGYYIQDKLIGCIVYSNRFKRINYLYVIKEFRNKGIAKQLIESSGAMAVLFAKKARQFWLNKGFNFQVSYNILIKGVD